VGLVLDTFRVAFKKGPGNRRLRVSLLLIIVAVVFGPLHGEKPLIQYLNLYLYSRLFRNY
jgi:MFS transporter, PCFT/HCP family, solute carrier family 46, member 3